FGERHEIEASVLAIPAKPGRWIAQVRRDENRDLQQPSAIGQVEMNRARGDETVLLLAGTLPAEAHNDERVGGDLHEAADREGDLAARGFPVFLLAGFFGDHARTASARRFFNRVAAGGIR